jgi:hypothetical protein
MSALKNLLLAGAMATLLLGAAGCSDPAQDRADTAKALKDEYGTQLTKWMTEISGDCHSGPFNPACMSDLNTVHLLLDNVQEKGKARSGTDKKLLTALDEVTNHYKRWSDAGCRAGGGPHDLETTCATLVNSFIASANAAVFLLNQPT